MKKLIQKIWGAARQALLRRKHKDRLLAVPVEDLPDSLRPQHLYLLGGKEPWSAAFICPCGCKQVIHLSLLPNDTPSWHLKLDRAGLPTLSPSVWRTQGCRSHFFVRHGLIDWCKQENVNGSRERRR